MLPNMNRTFLLLIVFVFSSCTDQSSGDRLVEIENRTLHSQVESLQKQNDSLIALLKKSKRKTHNKKVVQALTTSSTDSVNAETLTTKQEAPITISNASKKSNISEPAVREEKTRSYSGRCLATTKKGRQCLRNSRSGGYCWQHGG